MDVHRAARVMSAGHGGQVVLSQTTRDLLDEAFELQDLGEHRLKDLSAPQRLFQLGPGEFPDLKTLHQTNLPVQPTPLVGRDSELAEAGALLRGNRLVTLVGPGGSGKTRLALQLAAEAVEDFEGGVFWVPLQAVADPRLVESTIAQNVGARDGVAEFLRGRTALLLLDNLEQVLEAAPDLAELLRETSGVKLLATSREPLNLAGEQRFPVDPLPDDDAITLFLERARAVDPGFSASPAVGEICRRLDGLPLALELAAARVSVLSADALLARLDRSLPLLTGGARDVPERQQTLRATIEWSYELLDEDERRVFRSLVGLRGQLRPRLCAGGLRRRPRRAAVADRQEPRPPLGQRPLRDARDDPRVRGGTIERSRRGRRGQAEARGALPGRRTVGEARQRRRRSRCSGNRPAGAGEPPRRAPMGRRQSTRASSGCGWPSRLRASGSPRLRSKATSGSRRSARRRRQRGSGPSCRRAARPRRRRLHPRAVRSRDGPLRGESGPLPEPRRRAGRRTHAPPPRGRRRPGG